MPLLQNITPLPVDEFAFLFFFLACHIQCHEQAGYMDHSWIIKSSMDPSDDDEDEMRWKLSVTN